MIKYTDEQNVQVILSTLKFHCIKHVVASPGTTNMALVVSMQGDPYFEVYSCVDERSAAYMACGLSAELGVPVVLSCTGATASRNYLSGLTEAYYRKLPVLAITSTQPPARIGQHVAQVIDRSSIQTDVAKLSVQLPIVHDGETLWECEVKVNKAVLELKRHGGGPVHINLVTSYSTSFQTETLPAYKIVERITPTDAHPVLSGKVAVFVGAHPVWSAEQTEQLDRFCEAQNAVVFCDHTSGYRGKHRLLFALASGQDLFDQAGILPDVLIHIGEICGDYDNLKIGCKQVWRVSPDGEVRDTFRKLRFVFEMSEMEFFGRYADAPVTPDSSYFDICSALLTSVRAEMPVLPFSNIWVASQLAHKVPKGSAVHFGILNSLRAWNYFELPASVTTFSNVGGFGIDGCMSAFIGASMANRDKLYFLVIGDLAFFYDMNVLGNRHLGSNIRIILVNNGKGTEFTQYGHNGRLLGKEADQIVAAAGHFGQKSGQLVKNYVTDLGFDYISAASKDEFETVHGQVLSAEQTGRPLLFEVFTDAELESDALMTIRRVVKPTPVQRAKLGAKKLAKDLLGADGAKFVRRVMGQ